MCMELLDSPTATWTVTVERAPAHAASGGTCVAFGGGLEVRLGDSPVERYTDPGEALARLFSPWDRAQDPLLWMLSGEHPTIAVLRVLVPFDTRASADVVAGFSSAAASLIRRGLYQRLSTLVVPELCLWWAAPSAGEPCPQVLDTLLVDEILSKAFLARRVSLVPAIKLQARGPVCLEDLAARLSALDRRLGGMGHAEACVEARVWSEPTVLRCVLDPTRLEVTAKGLADYSLRATRHRGGTTEVEVRWGVPGGSPSHLGAASQLLDSALHALAQLLRPRDTEAQESHDIRIDYDARPCSAPCRFCGAALVGMLASALCRQSSQAVSLCRVPTDSPRLVAGPCLFVEHLRTEGVLPGPHDLQHSVLAFALGAVYGTRLPAPRPKDAAKDASQYYWRVFAGDGRQSFAVLRPDSRRLLESQFSSDLAALWGGGRASLTTRPATDHRQAQRRPSAAVWL